MIPHKLCLLWFTVDQYVLSHWCTIYLIPEIYWAAAIFTKYICIMDTLIMKTVFSSERTCLFITLSFPLFLDQFSNSWLFQEHLLTHSFLCILFFFHNNTKNIFVVSSDCTKTVLSMYWHFSLNLGNLLIVIVFVTITLVSLKNVFNKAEELLILLNHDP